VKYKESISFECLFATTCSEKDFSASAVSVFCTYFTCEIWAEIYSSSADVDTGVIEWENVQYLYVICFA
jgi:hypothetical protein